MNPTTMRGVLIGLTERWGGLVGVQVIYGPRSTKTVTLPTILTIGAVDFTSAPSTFGDAFGSMHSDETYTIACVIESTLAGAKDQQTATDEALSVYEAAQVALTVPDETLGVAGILWARMVGPGRVTPSSDPATTKVGRSTAITFGVQVMAAL
jgi:hypothetical protein